MLKLGGFVRIFKVFVVQAAVLLVFSPAHSQTNPVPTMAPTTILADLKQLPLAAFAKLPFLEGAKLSPNGEYIAGQFAVAGEQRFVVASLFGSGSKFQGALPDNLEVDGVLWVGSDNVVLRVRQIQPFAMGESVYVTRLIAFNRLTKSFTPLLKNLLGQHASDILWVPADGTTKILVAGQNSIFRQADFWPAVYSVDVATGEHSKVVGPSIDVMDWVADPAGVVRAKIENDLVGARRSLFYRTNSDRKFAKIASASFDDLNVPILFLPRAATAISLRSTKESSDALVEVDLETGKDVRTVYQAPEGRNIDSVRFDDVGHTILGVRLGGDISGGIRWIDPDLASLQAAFAKALQDRDAKIISLSADRTKMLVQIDRPDDPGRLYFYDTTGGKLQSVAFINPDILTQSAAKVSTIRYKARDGLEIEAIVTPPPGREAKSLAVVIMPHGGPWAHDMPRWDYWAQFIASRGYLVIQPNFRGSTGYGNEFLRKGEGQMGFAMQDDVNDALDWAVKQGMADPKRACVVGASYGGYVAMWGVARDPDLWRCTVSIAGVANLRREVNDFGGTLYAKRYREHWEKMTPDFNAVSPIRFIDRIKVPMLLIHGKKDLTVDHVQSKSMHAKMKVAGKDVEFLSLPKADHYFTREADRVALLTAIEGFLAKHNPAD